MFWLKLLSNLIKVLRAGESPRLIAAGFALGAVVGLGPVLTLQSVLLLLAAVVTKVNLGAAFAAMFVFSFVAYLGDPWFHALGYYLLTDVPALTGLWTALYNLPIVPFTRFNNTVVIGSLVTALVLAGPIFLLVKRGIELYRARWEAKVLRWPVVRYVQGLTIYEWFVRISSLR